MQGVNDPFNIRKMVAEGSTVEPVTAAEVQHADEVIANAEKELMDDLRAQEERLKLREMALEQLARYEIDLSQQLKEPKPVIARYGMTIGSEGNLSAIVGEAKSKKSFLCTAIVGDLLKVPGMTAQENGFQRRIGRVLWVDTEQSALHVRKIARRITHLTGWNDPTTIHPLMKLYALREEPPKERMSILRQAIEAWRPKLVVIDGIADLQYNTNDLEESERIVMELMALSSIYSCHILSVLHTNPNSDKARGHVGSSLQRKAETVLYVHKVGERSVVEPQFCRNEPFERFAFHIENPIDEGIPVPTDMPRDEPKESPELALLRREFGGAVERSVLIHKLRERGCSEGVAKMRVSRAIRRGLMQYDELSRIVSLPDLPPADTPSTEEEIE